MTRAEGLDEWADLVPPAKLVRGDELAAYCRLTVKGRTVLVRRMVEPPMGTALAAVAAVFPGCEVVSFGGTESPSTKGREAVTDQLSTGEVRVGREWKRPGKDVMGTASGRRHKVGSISDEPGIGPVYQRAGSINTMVLWSARSFSFGADEWEQVKHCARLRHLDKDGDAPTKAIYEIDAAQFLPIAKATDTKLGPRVFVPFAAWIRHEPDPE